MIDKSKAKKEEKLNMSLGKARNVLVKNILFELSKKCSMNVCHRCNKEIESVDELSIEHKTDWLNSDDPVKLFFDTNNIAFSHLSCNVRAPRTSNPVVTKDTDAKYRGIKYDISSGRKTKPWRATITVNGQRKHLGCYSDPTSAAKAYDDAAITYFGDKAITNKRLGLI